MYKNVAGQFVIVFAWDNAAGAPKSGDAANITGRVSKDSIDSAATNDVNPTEISNTTHKGLYAFLMSQSETNCDLLGVTAASSTADIDLQPVIIYTRDVGGIMTKQMTEAYAADGTAPTPAQALFLIMQMLTEKNVSGTIVTVKKLDGSSTAFTLTLDDDNQPTSITRAT